ncbi:MAG TPA: hypothetical protein VGH16_23365 [Candidatus Binatia bacterium]
MFEKQPLLLLSNTTAKVTIDSTEYLQVTDYDWTGFFDWLRSASGEVIGVRYYAFEEFRFVFKAIPDIPNVLVTGYSAAEFYFGENRQFDPWNSCDQAFGENEVYSSRDGKVAIAFGTSHLNAAERKSLESVARKQEISGDGTVR